MPRNHTLLLLLSILFGGCSSTSAAAPDESKEPPLQFMVTVGDKSVTLNEGDSRELAGSFSNPTISVAPLPYRVFDSQGISFKYPRSYTFEADFSDPDVKSWTLSGNDLKIMYFVFKEKVTAAEYADVIMAELGPKNCRITATDAKITLGAHSLPGTTIECTIAAHVMTMEIYAVPSQGKASKLLVLQDSLDDQGNGSKERTEAIKEIRTSFNAGR